MASAGQAGCVDALDLRDLPPRKIVAYAVLGTFRVQVRPIHRYGLPLWTIRGQYVPHRWLRLVCHASASLVAVRRMKPS